jgi:tellurite methyltransferase
LSGAPDAANDLPTPTPEQLKQIFGSVDVYLFDQLLRGNLHSGMSVLDAGCGRGRNLHYLLKAGFDVCAVDRDAKRLEAVRSLAATLAPEWDARKAVQADLRQLPYPEARFDAVLASAVLHFAVDPAEFSAQLDELWRVLAPGGLFWTRLASSIGLEDRVEALGNQRFRLPDGSDRFLVTERDLLDHTQRLDAELVDQIKTTNVQGLRCMTTWVLRKPPATAAGEGPSSHA